MPVRVVISPSQSSFFAGECFSATVTFTNVAGGPDGSPGRAHKRAAHSISSAPLARPPTSPGLPPRKSSVFSRDSPPARHGLIGPPIPSDKHLFIETRQSPVSPPFSRTHTLPLSSDHPHARKSSILDGQLSLDTLSPTTSVPPLALKSISESSHTPSSPLAISSSPRVSSPLSQSYSQPSNTVQAYPSILVNTTHHRRFSQQVHIGLGHPTPPPPSATFPKSTELILYSYAQLVGTVHVLPENNAPLTQEQTLRMNRIRRMLMRRKAVVGGGSMDISRSLHRVSGIQQQQQPPPSRVAQQQPYQHGRSTSFSQSLLSLLSSTPSDNISMPGGGHGLGLGINNNNNVIDELIDPETALPTFEAQPSMLAVDLVLAPGESKSYTYMIKLPEVLPPTYRGRALSFSYELVVGTCRGGGGLGAGVNSVSRVMKVPIRVYNHVTVDHPQRPYDILWPVKRNHHGKEIPEVQGRVVEQNENDDGGKKKLSSGSIRLPSAAGRKGEDETCLEELRMYATRLLTSLPPTTIMNVEDEVVSTSSVSSSSSSLSLSYSTTTTPTTINNNKNRDRREEEEEEEEEEDKSSGGCREAVEILTRVPKKASYDVNKEGIKVAELTFTKSAYRLGETVCGVVELNERVGQSRVLQLSAILEAHEVLPKTIGGGSVDNGKKRSLRRTYAEHYASFTLGMVRTTFALDIPSDASPGFQVKIDDDDHGDDDDDRFSTTSLGGLEWKIRLCLLVGVADSDLELGSERGVSLFRSLEREGGRGEWGSSWCAPRRFVPLVRRKKKKKEGVMMMTTQQEEEGRSRSWTRILVDSMWSAVTGVDEDEVDESHLEEDNTLTTTAKWREYDGIKFDKGVDFSGDDDNQEMVWEEVKLETVECEVPIKVWPGNTAFRAVDVGFDV